MPMAEDIAPRRASIALPGDGVIGESQATPNDLDRTFGPDIRYVSIPHGLAKNRPPSDGLQFL